MLGKFVDMAELSRQMGVEDGVQGVVSGALKKGKGAKAGSKLAGGGGNGGRGVETLRVVSLADVPVAAAPAAFRSEGLLPGLRLEQRGELVRFARPLLDQGVSVPEVQGACGEKVDRSELRVDSRQVEEFKGVKEIKGIKEVEGAPAARALMGVESRFQKGEEFEGGKESGRFGACLDGVGELAGSGGGEVAGDRYGYKCLKGSKKSKKLAGFLRPLCGAPRMAEFSGAECDGADGLAAVRVTLVSHF